MAKYWYSIVHAIIQCQDCDWEAKSYKNAQATAAKHAKKYKHRVSGELGIFVGYDYREDSSVVSKSNGEVSP